MIIQEPIQAAIWHCLNHYDFQDATFLAERLCAEVENEETIFMLATCYYRSNMTHQAYWLLQIKLPRSPQCRYLLAKCAYHLKKFAEAEAALSNVGFAELKNFDEISKEFGEIACFALQLIGKICTQTERYTLAFEAYKKALKLNPFLWKTFEELCNHGQNIDPNSVFELSNMDVFNNCQGNNINAMVLLGAAYSTACSIDSNLDLLTGNNMNGNYVFTTPNDQVSSQCVQLTTPNNNYNNSVVVRSGNGDCLSSGNSIDETQFLNNTNEGQNCNNFESVTPFRKHFKYLSVINSTSPSFGIIPLSPTDTPLGNNYTTPPNVIQINQEQKSIGKKLKGHVGSIINRKETPLQQTKPTVFTQTGNITPRAPNAWTGQNVRRSSRLFSNSNCSVKENSKTPNINKFAQPRSPPRKMKQRLTKITLNNDINEKDKKGKEKIETVTSSNDKVLINNSLNNAQTMAHHMFTLKKQSAEGLMVLLRELGLGYQNLTKFNCKEAIECFKAIPRNHYNTSWVQSMIALAYYEQRDYESAAAIFKSVHENEPNRMELMEIYSTTLWHLQREIGLSALAQDLLMLDKNSPITWCVAGNCFSVHKEHETAIKFFKRAVQVNPDFVYSYTLLGHELVVTEELDKAMSCFRTATLKDPRHYNAWFGIGTIYSKQERYELAELHYRRALKLNPKNSVIMVHIGVMQCFKQGTEQALQTLNAANAMDPGNPLCKFHIGSMYYTMGKYQDALRELEELKQIVPKESVVYYLIGKIHKSLGNIDSALMYFSWASDLDPKGANNHLKDAFDSINHASENYFNVETDGEHISNRSDDSDTY